MTIARNGLPVDRANKVLSTYVSPLAEPFYVRVRLPGDLVVATDVGTTLREGKLPCTVDGLKKALMKDLPVALRDIDISRLTVYPPGETKGSVAYTKMSTPLESAEEERPYHVDVL